MNRNEELRTSCTISTLSRGVFHGRPYQHVVILPSTRPLFLRSHFVFRCHPRGTASAILYCAPSKAKQNMPIPVNKEGPHRPSFPVSLPIYSNYRAYYRPSTVMPPAPMGPSKAPPLKCTTQCEHIYTTPLIGGKNKSSGVKGQR